MVVCDSLVACIVLSPNLASGLLVERTWGISGREIERIVYYESEVVIII